MIKRLSFLCIALFLNYWLIGQQANNCKTPLMGGYILDGQSYKLVASETPRVTIHAVFFSGFEYRIHFCSPNTQKYIITIYDFEKNKIFSDECVNYQTFYNIQFKSDIACIIELEAIDNSTNKKEYATYYFTIGFKEKSIFGK